MFDVASFSNHMALTMIRVRLQTQLKTISDLICAGLLTVMDGEDQANKCRAEFVDAFDLVMGGSTKEQPKC